MGFAFFVRFLYFERTRPTASTRQPCLMYHSTSNEARPRERSDRGRPLPLRQKKPLHTGVRKGCHYLVCLSVCPSVYMLVCVTFVVFTDCESCSRPISTIPVSMEAGEYGLTRGTWVFARRLEVVTVAGLPWIQWCVWVRRIFSCFPWVCIFKFIRSPRAASVESVKGLRQPANLPTENSRPPLPTRCTV